MVMLKSRQGGVPFLMSTFFISCLEKPKCLYSDGGQTTHQSTELRDAQCGTLVSLMISQSHGFENIVPAVEDFVLVTAFTTVLTG